MMAQPSWEQETERERPSSGARESAAQAVRKKGTDWEVRSVPRHCTARKEEVRMSCREERRAVYLFASERGRGSLEPPGDFSRQEQEEEAEEEEENS